MTFRTERRAAWSQVSTVSTDYVSGYPPGLPRPSPTDLRSHRLAPTHAPDTNSAQLAWSLHRELTARGLSPSLVIGKLSRTKVDLARSRKGCADSVGGRAAWDEYHTTLQGMLEAAAAAHDGQAHLVDVHGQTHRPATEVGHMLTNTELRCSCCTADPAPLDPTRSSVAAMAALPGWTGVEDVVRGPAAIGTLLEDAGYRAVPSAQTPHPCAVGCDRAAKDCKRCADDGRAEGGAEGGADCACPCPCTGFDNQQWRGTADGDGFGGCSFFWGANTLLRYAGGRGEKHQIAPLQGKVAATQVIGRGQRWYVTPTNVATNVATTRCYRRWYFTLLSASCRILLRFNDLVKQ